MLTALIENQREYLRYEVGEEDQQDKTSMRMLACNQIFGLVPMKLYEDEGKQELLFDTTGLVSVSKILEKGKLSLDGLVTIVCGILSIADSLADYLIPSRMLLLRKDWIFLEFEHNRVMMICLPVEKGEKMELEAFCRTLLQDCCPGDQRGMELFDRFRRILNMTPFNRNEIQEIKKRIDYAFSDLEEPEEREKPVLPQPLIQKVAEREVDVGHNATVFSEPAPQTPTRKRPEKLVRTQEASMNQNSPQKLIRNSHEQQETSPLHNEGQIGAYLIRARSGERILITKDLFRIGKNSLWADYVVNDVPTVSRNHASILLEEGKYYFVDNQSANGSVIDGKTVEAQKKILLTNGCSVTLASELFYFYVGDR